MQVLEGIAEAGREDFIRNWGTEAEFLKAVSHIAERLLLLEVGFWDMAIGESSPCTEVKGLIIGGGRHVDRGSAR